MFGTFPKDFFPSGNFPRVWQLPKCAISQAATSKVYPSHSAWPPACSSLDARPPSPTQPQRSASHCSLQLLRRPNLTFEKLPLGKIPLGSCHWGKYPWEVATGENSLGKFPLVKNPFGKCLTPRICPLESSSIKVNCDLEYIEYIKNMFIRIQFYLSKL